MSSLRDELIEAGAKAFNGTYRDLDTGEQVQSPWEGDLADMERALDAILDKLTEQTAEWEECVDNFSARTMLTGLVAKSLVAALRVQPGDEK